MGNPENKLKTIQSAINKWNAAATTETIPTAQTLFLPERCLIYNSGYPLLN